MQDESEANDKSKAPDGPVRGPLGYNIVTSDNPIIHAAHHDFARQVGNLRSEIHVDDAAGGVSDTSRCLDDRNVIDYLAGLTATADHG